MRVFRWIFYSQFHHQNILHTHTCALGRWVEMELFIICKIVNQMASSASVKHSISNKKACMLLVQAIECFDTFRIIALGRAIGIHFPIRIVGRFRSDWTGQSNRVLSDGQFFILHISKFVDHFAHPPVYNNEWTNQKQMKYGKENIETLLTLKR